MITRFVKQCFSLSLWLSGFAAAGADDLTRGQIQIEVLTTNAFPMTLAGLQEAPQIQVQVAHIDAIERVEQKLSQRLPPDPAAAQAQALQNIGALTEQDGAHLRQAAGGLALANEFGVEWVPAIVLNREAVVYGVTNVADALGRYLAWRKAQSR